MPYLAGVPVVQHSDDQIRDQLTRRRKDSAAPAWTFAADALIGTAPDPADPRIVATWEAPNVLGDAINRGRAHRGYELAVTRDEALAAACSRLTGVARAYQRGALAATGRGRRIRERRTELLEHARAITEYAAARLLGHQPEQEMAWPARIDLDPLPVFCERAYEYARRTARADGHHWPANPYTPQAASTGERLFAEQYNRALADLAAAARS